MKVIKSTGLVPVKALTRIGHLGAGKVFGLDPSKVASAILAEEVELFPIPDGVETVDVSDVLPRANKGGIPAAEAPKPGAQAEIEIPDNWKDAHWMTRVKLARQLRPDFTPPDGKWTDNIADQIIADALAARGGAANAGSGGGSPEGQGPSGGGSGTSETSSSGDNSNSAAAENPPA